MGNRLSLPLMIMMLAGGTGMEVNGQCNPSVVPTLSCEDAPLICLQDFCYMSREEPFFCCNGWCGANTAVHNPQYFALTAISKEISIHIHVDSCSGGNGLQSALLNACPWTNMDVLTCDPGAPPGGTMVLNYSGATIGETYWLLIDGSNGSTCHYTITQVSGVNAPGGSFELLPEMTLADTDIVCPGYTGLMVQTGPVPPNPTIYIWETGWNQESYSSTEPHIILDIPADADEGVWDICVSAKSACDTSNRVCIQIEIQHLPDAVKPVSILCADAFPFTWGSETITGPGIYAEQFVLPGNCVIDSIWIIESYPDYPDGMIDTMLCTSSFDFEGVTYEQSGMYALSYPALGANGCDSIAYLNLTLGGMDLIVETNCEGPAPILHPHVIIHDDKIDTLMYAWHLCSYDSLISTAITFQPDSMLCYSLIVDNGLCQDTVSATYVLECPSTCDLSSDFLCAGDSLVLQYPYSAGPGAQLHWVVVSGDTTWPFYNGGETVYFTNEQPGVYAVSAILVDSGISYTCQDIFIIPEPVSASLCCYQTICGTCTDLTVTSESGIVDVVISDGMGFLLLSSVIHATVEVCPPPGIPTTYSLTEILDSETGCPGFVNGPGEADVLILEVPDVLITQNINTLCAMSSSQNQYRWLPCGSDEVLAATSCYTPAESGCYCVEASTVQGCRDTACVEMMITSLDILENNAIKIFPNPSSGNIYYHFATSILFPVQWRILDVVGQEVAHGKVAKYEGQFELPSQLNAGTYFVQMITGNDHRSLEKLITY